MLETGNYEKYSFIFLPVCISFFLLFADSEAECGKDVQSRVRLMATQQSQPITDHQEHYIQPGIDLFAFFKSNQVIPEICHPKNKK